MDRAALSQARTRLNALDDLCQGVFAGAPYSTNTIALPFTLADGNSYTPLTLNRILLSYSFMSQGLVQTVIKQPVEDAFRGGIHIKTDELDDEDLKLLMATMRKSRKRWRNDTFKRNINPNAAINLGNSDFRVAMDVMNWSRLYGGAGLIINTDQDFKSELDVEKIGPDSPLEFIAADRWELILSQVNIWDGRNPTPFNFYGLPLHRSRVVKVLGVEAPSYIRLRLQGWGMSEIERCIRAINSFVKFETLIFELLDEAKIDVYSIEGFNDALLTDEGTANVKLRMQLSNQLKSFQNALAMDKEDEYQQKQISWSGLAEMWNEFRLNLCSSLKFPMTKLFGQSATGFGGGQDAIENYNSVVESVRMEAEPVLTEMIDLRCQQLFGFIPDYEFEWKPLKLLDGVEEETVKTSKQSRIMEQFQQRLVTGQEASRLLKMENLLPIETEVSKGLRDVEPTLPNAGEPSEGGMEMSDKAAKAKAQKPPAKGK